MKRLPSLLRSTPPSPRTPSVTRMPLTLGGHTMPVGWNCTNSMSSSAAPALYASAWPSAVYSQLLLVTLNARPTPPVASTTAFAGKHFEAAALAIVGERARAAVAVHQQSENGVLGVNVDALMDAVILQSADHFETGAVAHVRQARIAMPAEIALQDAAVFGAVENRAPGFQFLHPRRSFLGVQLRHAAIVQILAAAHGVGEMDAPVVAIVHVAHGRGHAAFRHHRVRLAQQRFRDHGGLRARGRRFDGRAQSRAARADHQHVVFVNRIIRHAKEFSNRPDAHRAQADVQIREAHEEHADPGPLHVVAIQAGHAVVSSSCAPGEPDSTSLTPADQVAQRVAAEGVAAQQNRIQDQDQRSDADPEVLDAVRAGEPQRPVAVIQQDEDEDDREVQEVAVDVLQDQRELASRPDRSCAARRRCRRADRPRRLCSRRRDSSSR